MNKNIKRHIKAILSVIGVISFPILSYCLVAYMPFAIFITSTLSIATIVIMYKIFYDEFK